jgi:hypothetical protein
MCLLYRLSFDVITMDISTLNRGQRYLFYYTNPHANSKTFRANYLGSVTYNQYTTLVVNKYHGEDSDMSPNLHYIGVNMIARIETLVDILEPIDNITIPEDVLLEIDKFW